MTWKDHLADDVLSSISGDAGVLPAVLVKVSQYEFSAEMRLCLDHSGILEM